MRVSDPLFNLQELDIRVDDMRARALLMATQKRDLLALIAELESAAKTAEDNKKAAQVIAHKHETEIQNLETKIQSFGDKMLRVTSPKQIQALESEKLAAEEKLASTEESLLETYGQVEECDKKLDELRKNVDSSKERLTTLKQDSTREIMEIKEKIGRELSQRQELVSQVDASLLKMYTALRAEFRGPVVFAVDEDGCQGCGKTLSGSSFLRLRNPDRKPFACDNCGRLLVFSGRIE